MNLQVASADTGRRPGTRRSAMLVAASAALVGAVVVGGRADAACVILVVAAVVAVVERPVPRVQDAGGRAVSGARSVAVLTLCLLAALWSMRVVALVLEATGLDSAASVGLWPVPLAVAVALYTLVSRYARIGLVDDWFSRGTVARPGVLLTLAVVPLSGLALVLWAWAAGEDGSGHEAHLSLVRDASPVVLVAGALGFAVVNAAAEELAYNGVLQRALGLEATSVWAVLTAATAFGASHWFGFPSGWWGVALAGVYGAMLSVLRQVSGGLLLPWIAHVLADLTIVAILVAIL